MWRSAIPARRKRRWKGSASRWSRGEHLAILGRVGSGKSTIARLLLGLHQPGEGVILLDGIDIRQLDPVDLRRKIGSVMQDGALLSGTLRENIVLAREEIDDEAMVRAAELSGTHGFAGQDRQWL